MARKLKIKIKNMAFQEDNPEMPCFFNFVLKVALMLFVKMNFNLIYFLLNMAFI